MNYNKIKILLMSPSPNFAGGISRWTKHILDYYSLHKNDCFIEYLNISVYNLSIDRGIFRRIYDGIIGIFRTIFYFNKYTKRNKYDVVHKTTSASISLFGDLILLYLTKKLNLKFIIHFHFGRIPDLIKRNNWEYKLLKKVVRLADKAIVIDLVSYNSLVSSGFTNVMYLPNPLSDEIEQNINDIVLDNDDTISNNIVFVGQMLRTKGIYELVEVCSSIKGITLSMYGQLTNNIKESLVNMLKDMCNGDDISWLRIYGEIPYETIIGKMKAATIFVLPTYTEGFPNVILESMACGCPIIASSVGAIPEMLAIDSSEPCGICVEPKNKEQLKDAILYLLHNSEKAKVLGDRAAIRVRKEYSMASVWNKLLDVWKN